MVAADGSRSLLRALLLGVALMLHVPTWAATATPSVGTSAAQLPSGWAIEGDELVWTSAAALRMGGARYEFRSGARLLGYPRQVGNTLRLRLDGARPMSGLSVWAAGRRLA